MSVLNTGLAKTTASTGGYDIDNSLRLNDDDSAYLSRTPTTAGNQKTWTFSAWVKRGNLGTSDNGTVFSAVGGGAEDLLRFVGSGGGSDADKLNFYIYDGGYTAGNFTTSQVFRDTSAWYHLVWVWDTTNNIPTTGDNRVKLYVNGERITAWDSSSYPSLDATSGINSTLVHDIAHQATHSSRYLDGYIAEVNFIDGAAKEPTDFGEFDATYGHWKPKAYDTTVSGSYGTNGFYLPMGDSSLVSASGGDSTGTDGKYKYHIFNQDGTFAVGSASAGSQVEYLVIAGGGGGSSSRGGGGGGAGGYRTGRLSIASGDYAITVGAAGVGGTYPTSHGDSGGESTFSTITSVGGGYGGEYSPGGVDGAVGGSGGGGGANYGTGGAASSSPSGQGYAGGTSSGNSGGGGGGSSSVGANDSGDTRAAGGNGTASSITGTSVIRAAGGKGSAWSATTAGSDTVANTGNGGWAEYTGSSIAGKAGGSGVVIVIIKGVKRTEVIRR